MHPQKRRPRQIVSAQTQAETELQVFREFAAATQRPILYETISHRDPPEPDIVCEIVGEGLVGFELTELVDFDFMARLDWVVKTKKVLAQFWKEQLSEFQSQSFGAKYDDAILYFHFGAAVGSRKRNARFFSIFEELLALPDGFIGEALKLDQRFLPVLERVRISRSRCVGPIFNVDNFDWLGDPTWETVSNKLSKTYGCTYPVELLAYIDLDVLPPEGVWRASLAEAAAALDASDMSRLWVFDSNKHQILAVYP